MCGLLLEAGQSVMQVTPDELRNPLTIYEKQKKWKCVNTKLVDYNVESNIRRCGKLTPTR